MFLGSPLINNSDQSTDHIKPQIAFIQNQVVYDVKLKVSSLSGLRFLFQQQQRVATKYPHSEILISHMVSFPLRQNVLAMYNSRRYDQFIRNGEEPEELMCEKWLTFDNKLVLEILVEACRPRTREQCAKEFIMFLSVAIPQKFKVNADNFSRDFYEPMMKSVHDLDHLSALFMKDTSIRTQNSNSSSLRFWHQRQSRSYSSLDPFFGHSKRSVSTATRTRRVTAIQDVTACNQVHTL